MMLAQQVSPMVVARTLHVSRMTVRLWARRFVAEGVPGVLRDATRPGRRPRLAQLAQVAERGTTTQKVARRARIVLMLAQQVSPMVVARTLHVSRMTVRLWARRFVAEGVPGVLRDATRPGRRPRLTRRCRRSSTRP